MRGWASPVASAAIVSPGATLGMKPGFHPSPTATLIGGIRYCFGSGRAGLGPIWLFSSNGGSLHAASARTPARTTARVTLPPPRCR